MARAKRRRRVPKCRERPSRSPYTTIAEPIRSLRLARACARALTRREAIVRTYRRRDGGAIVLRCTMADSTTNDRVCRVREKPLETRFSAPVCRYRAIHAAMIVFPPACSLRLVQVAVSDIQIEGNILGRYLRGCPFHADRTLRASRERGFLYNVCTARDIACTCRGRSGRLSRLTRTTRFLERKHRNPRETLSQTRRTGKTREGQTSERTRTLAGRPSRGAAWCRVS